MRHVPMLLVMLAGTAINSSLMAAAPAGAPSDAKATAPAAAPTSAGAGLDLNAPLATDPSLVTGTLDNGLRYIVRRQATPPGRAFIWIHVSSGSLNETDAQRGIAHYLEHMAFNGSKNFPPGQVVPFFESLGLTFGRHQNAFTSFDQTTYQLSLPNTKPETVERALTFFSDVATGLLLNSEEIEKERQIIMEEKRSRLSPGQRVGEAMIKRMAPGSLIGERLPIGVEATILGVQPKDFRDYYGRWYTPSNMTLMVVGDIDPTTIVAGINAKFASAPKAPKPVDQDARIKPYTTSQAIIATDPELPDISVGISRIDRLRPPVTTVATFREDLVETIGSWAFNRRMSEKVSAGKASFLSATASTGNFANAARQTNVSASGKPDNWRPMLVELGEELQRARIHGFTQQELDDARKELIAQAEQSVSREATIPSDALIRRYNSAVAEGDVILGAAKRLELVKGLLPTITPAEVSAFFAQEYDPTNVSFTLTGKAGPNIPSESELLSEGRKAVDVKPAPLVQTARATSLMEKLPEAGAVAEASTHAASGVTSAWLANGVRVHHRFMDARKDDVTITISLAAGSIQENATNRGVSEAAGLGWGRRATSKLSSTQIRDLMTGKKVNTGGGAGADAFTLSVSGSPAELETGMQLAHLLLTDAKIEAPAFEQWKTRQTQAIAARKTQPQGLLAEIVADATFPKGEARGRPLTVEQVDAVTLEKAQARLDEILRTAPIEVAIVGDIDKDKAMALVTRYVGSLAARPRISEKTLASLRELQRPSGPIFVEREIETRTPQAIVLVGFWGPDIQNVRDTRLMSMASRILSSRMIKTIREDKQLVYSIGAQSIPGTEFKGYGRFLAAAPTATEKTGELAKVINEMYTEFAKTGPTAEELDVAKKQMANQLDESMEQPSFWLQRMANLTYRGLNMDDAVNAPAAIQAFTADQIRDAFASYFKPEHVMTFIVKPAPTKDDAAGTTPATPK
jgi:zinc protease